MPAVQTTYTANMAAGLEGMVATMFDRAFSDETRLCETAAGIGFGRVVTQGTAAKGAVLGGATGYVGITLRDVTLVKTAAQTVDLYQQTQNMGVMLKGDIWVRPVAAVAVGASATYDSTTGQLNPAAAGVAIVSSRYMTAAGAGELAILRIGDPTRA